MPLCPRMTETQIVPIVPARSCQFCVSRNILDSSPYICLSSLSPTLFHNLMPLYRVFNLYKGTNFTPEYDVPVFSVCLSSSFGLKSTWFDFSLHGDYFFFFSKTKQNQKTEDWPTKKNLLWIEPARRRNLCQFERYLIVTLQFGYNRTQCTMPIRGCSLNKHWSRSLGSMHCLYPPVLIRNAVII